MLPDDLLRRMRVRLEAFEAEARMRRESARRRSVLLRSAGKLCPGLAVLGLAGWALGQGVEIKTDNGAAADVQRFKVETGAATVNAYFLNSNLGIWTSAPQYFLHLQKDAGLASGEHVLAVFRRDASGGGGVIAYQADGAAVTASRIRSSQATDLRLGTGGNGDSMTILASNGNVGVGTTAPEFNLHVLSTTDPAKILVDGVGVVGPNVVGRRANGTPAAKTAVAANDMLLYLGADGYDGSAYTTSGRAYLGMYAAQNWTGAARGTYLRFGTTNNGSAGSSEKMRIADNGNVGIGTTAPENRLHVEDLTSTHVAVQLENADAVAGLELETQTATASGEAILNLGVNTNRALLEKGANPTGLWFRMDTRAGVKQFGWFSELAGVDTETQLMSLTEAGYLGVATTAPATLLHVNGTTDTELATHGLFVLGPTTGANLSMDQNEIMARNNGTESDLFLQNDGGDVVIHGGAAAATKIIFTDAGNVGIGTTTPAVPFHIVSTGDDKFRIEGDGSGRIGVQLYQGATHRSTWAYDATNNRTVIRAYNGGIADRMRMLDGFDGIQGDGNFNDSAFGPSEWVIGRAEPGDVLCLQGTRTDEDGKKRAVVAPCGEKNCPRVIGVAIPTDEIPHHGNPEFEHQDKLGPGAEWLAAWRKNHLGLELTGFREVKVIGPIRVGDLLVASGLPGYARAKKHPKPGTCIGKAAESLEEGKGTVWTRVHLQ